MLQSKDEDGQLVQIIHKAMLLMVSYPDLKDDLLEVQLITEGIEKTIARDCTIFIPAALARIVFSRAGPRLSDYYLLVNYRKRERSLHPLMENDVYRVAHGEFSRYLPDRDDIRLLVSRDPEITAIDQAVQNGGNPDNLIGGPLLVFEHEE